MIFIVILGLVSFLLIFLFLFICLIGNGYSNLDKHFYDDVIIDGINLDKSLELVQIGQRSNYHQYNEKEIYKNDMRISTKPYCIDNGVSATCSYDLYRYNFLKNITDDVYFCQEGFGMCGNEDSLMGRAVFDYDERNLIGFSLLIKGLSVSKKGVFEYLHLVPTNGEFYFIEGDGFIEYKRKKGAGTLRDPNWIRLSKIDGSLTKIEIKFNDKI